MYDLDAVANEAQNEPFKFKFGGQEYSIPCKEDVDTRVAEAIEKGDLYLAFSYLLGPDQYDRFHAEPLPARKAVALLEAWSSHNGISLGDS